jgi:site-specific DNA recombinase
MTLECPVTLRPSGRALRLIEPGGTTVTTSVDPSLLDLLIKARAWWARLADGKTTIASLAREEGVNDSWVSRVVRLNFLSPRLVGQILEGNQSANLEARRFTSGGPLPARWEEQERGFGAP